MERPVKIKRTVKGADELIAQFRYLAHKIPDTARKQMHRGADKVVQEAQLNAPVEKHNLEKAIHKEVSYGERGRLQIDIVVGGEINGINVDQYALEIHEHYESYTPSKETLAKRQANPGRYVGEKFLERALTSPRVRIVEGIFQAIMKELPK